MSLEDHHRPLIALDLFLKINAVDFSQDYDHKKISWGKSNPISSGKNMQSLVKRADFRGKAGRTKIYDWVDNRADENGPFFTRRKYFDGKGCRQQAFSELRNHSILTAEAVKQLISLGIRMSIILMSTIRL